MLIPDQSHLFDIPADITYLNCASQSPSLIASHRAGARGLARKHHPWDPERANLARELAQARALFASLIGAEARDIAHMTATSYGAAVAARNLFLDAGQKILLFEGQFPSNVYAWQKLGERDGADVVVVPRPADGDWTSALLARIGPGTGLVALENSHWSDGGLIDLDPISDAVREVGAAFFIDATQAIGARPFDVARLDPDFVACSAYKWLLCPDAVGFLYVAPRRQSGVPIEDNHATRILDSSMEASSGYGARYVDGAERFDQGAADNMVQMPMAVAALEQLLAWGVASIEETLRLLTDRAADEAEARGFAVPAKAHRVAHYIGLTLPGRPDDLVERLKAQGIHTSLRGGALRISPHLFNSEADIARLFEELDAILL